MPLKSGNFYAIAVLNLNPGIAYAEIGQEEAGAARLSDSSAVVKENNFDNILNIFKKMENDGKTNLSASSS